jgi:hypothetical protein
VISDAGSIPAASTMRERPGFDGINELWFHAGIGAHLNENRMKTATKSVSAKVSNVIMFPVRHAVALQMAA